MQPGGERARERVLRNLKVREGGEEGEGGGEGAGEPSRARGELGEVDEAGHVVGQRGVDKPVAVQRERRKAGEEGEV